MNGRILGVVLLMLALGAAGGYAVAVEREPDDEPQRFASPVPMPAADPSYPVREYHIEPDPQNQPLKAGIALRDARFEAEGLTMTAPVPRGWQRVDILGPEWNFSVAANPPNTYLLRIGILAGNRVDVRVAVGARVSALEASESDGNLENLVVEEQTDTGFVATYIDTGGFQRIEIDRFLPRPGSGDTIAFATVALTGRVVDRDGMEDLSDRIVAGLRAP